MYVPRSGSRPVDCVPPLESVALAIKIALLAPGVFQSNSHSRHAFGFESPFKRASLHVIPPSSLISTFVICPLPVHAAPRTGKVEFAGTLSPCAGLEISALVRMSDKGVSSIEPSRLFQNA